MGQLPTISQTEAFCAVADTDSYSVAASKIAGATPMSLYRRVQRFEKAVGHGMLIAGSPKSSTTLTVAGREILPWAKRVMSSARALTEVRPSVLFSAYPSIVQQLVDKRPDLLDDDVPLVLTNVTESWRREGGRGLLLAVAHGELDLAVAPSAGLHGASSPTSMLDEQILYEWSLRVITPAKHRLAALERALPGDIADLRICAAPRGHRSRELLDSALRSADLNAEIALESTSQEMLVSVAKRSARYVAVIPDDAFGSPDTSLGPHLVDAFGRRMGGSYSLYSRKVGSEPSGREQEVARMAEAIGNALRDVQTES